MAKKSFFVGILCIILVSGLLIAGCDNPAGSEGDGIDSALVARWHSTQGAADSGSSVVFEITADGRITGAAFTGGDWAVTTSGGRISASYTANGVTIGGSADYFVDGTALTFSNPGTDPGNVFNTDQSSDQWQVL
jgi:hypothetical protein